VGVFAADLQRVEIRMILIAGSNVAAMEEAAQALFRAGHVPVLGEWIAAPLSASERTFEDVFTPVLERLVERCDALLRLPGASSDADAVVSVARARGLRVFYSLADALAG
jgi:hypothetical protein